jgi:Protein of unknown function (DUF3106)
MTRYFPAGALLLWLVVVPIAAAQEGAAKPAGTESRGSAPAAPKAPGNINDPGANIAQRLLAMTPEQRERALEKFPPARQAQIRQRLERLDSLPPQQKNRLIRQYQMLASLPPEKQLLVRRQIQAFNRLPADRKRIVGPEMQKLRRMPESQREARVASEEFKSKFSPAEQQMLSDVSQYLPLE